VIDLPDTRFPYLALITGIAATIMWGVVLFRSIRARREGMEHRGAAWFVMPLSAFIVSIGTLASALGFAIQRGAIDIDISSDTLSLIASMGRGALAAAGAIVLASYRPRRSP
jgi:energy-converting hydrogenase Eha subunit E